MQISQIIGERYELQTRIGQGRMGAVYLAHDTETEQNVAIKALHEDILSDESMRERFRREGEALRRLQHPAIVTLLDYVVTDTQDYLVLEYMAGGALRDVLMETPQLPIPRFLQLARDLSAALTYAHNSHVLHRDIKPGNVLMAEDGTPRLTDFSVAQLGDRTRMTETGVIIGTSAYVSPEIYSNSPADERSDIWSLGVMFYEMVTGELPFQGEHVTAMLLAILSQNPPDILAKRPDAPPALVNLIYMMLLKDPNDRIQTMQRVHDEIVALIQGEPSNLPKILPMETPSNTAKNIIQALSGSWQNRQNLMEDTDSLDNLRPDDETREKSKPKAKPRNLWQWTAIALSAVLLVISGILAGTLLNTNTTATLPLPNPAQTAEPQAALPSAGQPGQSAAPGQVPSNGQAQTAAPGQVPPLGGPPPGANRDPYKILVADFAIEGDDTFTARRIATELQAILGNEALYHVEIMLQDAAITSADAAQKIADEQQATLIIWYHADDDTLHIQPAGAELFPAALLDTPTIQTMSHLEIARADIQAPALLPYVAANMALLHLNAGDLYEFARYLAVLQDNAGDADSIPGATLTAQVYRAMVNFGSDNPTAIEALNAALTLDDDNPLLLIMRGMLVFQENDVLSARIDIDAVRTIAPKYTVPTQIDMLLTLVTGNSPHPVLREFERFDKRNPNGFLLTLQGLGVYATDRYPDSGNLFSHALQLSPDIIYAYFPRVLLALRSGNLPQAQEIMRQISAITLDAQYSNRLMDILFGETMTPNPYQSVAAAFSNMIEGDWETAIVLLEVILEQNSGLLVENYLFQGIAACNLGDYAAAEAAYTTALELPNSLDIVYLLRAEVRRYEGNATDADADIATVRQKTAALSNWQPLIADFESGKLTCKTLLGNESNT